MAHIWIINHRSDSWGPRSSDADCLGPGGGSSSDVRRGLLAVHRHRTICHWVAAKTWSFDVDPTWLITWLNGY